MLFYTMIAYRTAKSHTYNRTQYIELAAWKFY